MIREALYTIATAAALLGAPLALGSDLHGAIEDGDVGAALKRVANGKALTEPNEVGALPIHLAAHAGQVEVLRALVTAGVDVDARVPETALRRTARDGLAGVRQHVPGATPLQFAVEGRQHAAVETLLALGADPSQENRAGQTPAWLSARSGDAEIVDRLLDAGASPVDALVGAVLHDQRVVVERVLARGAAVNERATSGMTALVAAAITGNLDLIETLLARGADPRSDDSRIAAQSAAANGRIEAARMLVRAGARPQPSEQLAHSAPSFLRSHSMHATGVLHFLLAQDLESEGERPEAAQAYRTAAVYFLAQSDLFINGIAMPRRSYVAARQAYTEQRGYADDWREINERSAARPATQTERFNEIAAGEYAGASRMLGGPRLPPVSRDNPFVGPIVDTSGPMFGVTADNFSGPGVVENPLNAATVFSILDERFAEFLPQPDVTDAGRFLLQTRKAWLAGRLEPMSREFRMAAAMDAEAFLGVYAQLAPAIERAQALRAFEPDEFLIGIDERGFVLTNRTWYQFASGDVPGSRDRALALSSIAAHKRRAARTPETWAPIYGVPFSVAEHARRLTVQLAGGETFALENVMVPRAEILDQAIALPLPAADHYVDASTTAAISRSRSGASITNGGIR